MSSFRKFRSSEDRNLKAQKVGMGGRWGGRITFSKPVWTEFFRQSLTLMLGMPLINSSS